jgi:uncharacterized protein YqgQ
MQSIMDVRNLLKRFGTVIYTGDHVGDCELMLDELRELKELRMIDAETFRIAMMIVKSERNRIRLD